MIPEQRKSAFPPSQMMDSREPRAQPERMNPRLSARELLRTARPKQWVKNVLVFAAPGAAGELTDRTTLTRAIVTFVVFCLTASGAYFVNDALDRSSDRLHPRKRHRPVASGTLSVATAMSAGALLVAGGIGLSWVLRTPRLTLIVGVYIALTLSYSLWLKRLPVIGLVAVASGFVIRSIAGGVSADVQISQWFLIVTSFGSLFIVAGKRQSDQTIAGTKPAQSPRFLRDVRATTSAVAILAYCLWAFEKAATAGGTFWFQLSILPFVVGILRYTLLLERGVREAPEDILLSDGPMLSIAGLWLFFFCMGIYVG